MFNNTMEGIRAGSGDRSGDPTAPLASSKPSDVFSVRKLEWGISGVGSRGSRLGHGLTKMAANNSVIVLATKNCCLQRWNLEGTGDPEEIEISRRTEDDISRVFLDPTGSHTLICLKNADNFYLHSRSQRPKKVSKLQGVVECVAFDRQQGTDTSTKSFLVGTSLGFIYEISFDSSGKEKLCQQVYKLDKPQPITALHIETFSSPSGQDGGATLPGTPVAGAAASPAGEVGGSKIFVMCTTPSPTRLYLFLGGPGFPQVFSAERGQDNTPSFTELPGTVANAEMHTFSKPPSTRAQTFAMTTMLGIYHGSLLLSSTQNSKDNVLNEASLLMFEEIKSVLCPDGGNAADTVLSISITEFHFFVLQVHQLVAVSRLNEKVVQVWKLDNRPGNRPLCLSRDETKNVIWLLTESSIHQVILMNEDRNVWSIFLQRALTTGEERQFDSAYQYCRRAEDRTAVHQAHAELHLSKGRVDEAALHFAKSDLSFEDVVLMLVSKPVGEKKPGVGDAVKVLPALQLTNGVHTAALCTYLTEKLRLIPTTAKSQRTMVCTWLSELLLQRIAMSRLNAPSGQTSGEGSLKATGAAEEEDLVNQFKDFIRTNRSYLDQATTLDLLVARGLRSLLLFYVKMISDYEHTLSLLVGNGSFTDALAVMNVAPIEKMEGTLYRLAPLLIANHPENTVSVLLSKPGLKMKGILPALLRYSELLDRQYASEEVGYLDVDSSDQKVNFAIFFMQHFIANCLADGVVPEPLAYHTLVYLLAKYDGDDEAELCKLFQGMTDRFERNGRSVLHEYVVETDEIDLQHCLRTVERFNRNKSRVLIYNLLGMPSAAVAAALAIDVMWAKELASACNDSEIKKGLWLSIAKYMIHSDSGNPSSGDVHDALVLLDESNGLLKIEDILPLLPDFTEIDVFKDHICATLESCGHRIENLQQDMDDLSASSEEIQKELDSMKMRGYSAATSQKCEFCPDMLFLRQYYLFPCGHGYHCDCALAQASSILGANSNALVDANKTATLIESILAKHRGVAGAKESGNKRVIAKLELLQTELDGYIAAECALCGSVIIKLVAEPLISVEDVEEAKSWSLEE